MQFTVREIDKAVKVHERHVARRCATGSHDHVAGREIGMNKLPRFHRLYRCGKPVRPSRAHLHRGPFSWRIARVGLRAIAQLSPAETMHALHHDSKWSLVAQTSK